MLGRVFGRVEPMSHDAARRVLVPLLAIDAILIAAFAGAHVANVGAADKSIPFVLDITLDWSLGEVFNYAKWAACAALLFLAWRAGRSPLLLALAAVFALLLADDMLQIHERWGAAFARAAALPKRMGPLRGQDLGELAAMAVLGATTVAILLAGFARTPRDARGAGFAFLGVLGLLVLCGIVADMASSAVLGTMEPGKARALLQGGLHVVEDGGEMVGASLACALASGIWAGSRLASRRSLPAARSARSGGD